MTTLSNLDWADGKANPSGIQSIAYFVRKSDIVSPLPKIGDDGIAYVEDIKLATGKKFQTIYTTQGAGSVTFELTGEADCVQPVNKAKLSYPDINDMAKTFATSYCNAKMVFIVPHNTVDGVRFAVFGLEMDASTKLTGNSGDKPGSAKGLTIEVESPDYVALPNYLGLIETDKGILDCATNIFTEKNAAPAT